MNKKALLKAILVVLAFVSYTTVACFAVETKNAVLIGATIVPLIIAGVVAIGFFAYEYFKEDDR